MVLSVAEHRATAVKIPEVHEFEHSGIFLGEAVGRIEVQQAGIVGGVALGGADPVGIVAKVAGHLFSLEVLAVEGPGG